LSFVGGVIGCLVVGVLVGGWMRGGRRKMALAVNVIVIEVLILFDERFFFSILKCGREGKRERDEKRKC
jgi:hypothetical protein